MGALAPEDLGVGLLVKADKEVVAGADGGGPQSPRAPENDLRDGLVLGVIRGVEDHELLTLGYQDPFGLPGERESLFGGDLPFVGDDKLGKLNVGGREKLPRAGTACSTLAVVVPVDSHGGSDCER